MSNRYGKLRGALRGRIARNSKQRPSGPLFQLLPNGSMKMLKDTDRIDVAEASAGGQTPQFFFVPEVSKIMVNLLIASIYTPIELIIGKEDGTKLHLWCEQHKWIMKNSNGEEIWRHNITYTDDGRMDPGGSNDVLYEVLASFIHPMTPQERKQTIRMMADKAVEAKKIRDDRLKKQEQSANGKACAAVLMAWIKEDLKIGKPSASGWHKLEHAFRSKEVVVIAKVLSEVADHALGIQDMQVFGVGNNLPRPQVFVVEHDWAAAFSGAEDFDVGNVPLPYELTAFEFSISGLKVIALFSQTRFIPFVEIEGTWTIPQLGYFRTNDEEWKWEYDKHVPQDFFEKLKTLILRQVRAVCIMMDAEVVETNEVEAPEKLNRIRISQGKVPLAKYHIVRLHSKYARKRSEDSTPTGVRQRMHWVRGHYTHLDREPMTNAHDQAWKFHNGRWRRWKNWFLRGDPDLGFVEKEYRL